jgi:GTP-binding protein EngB required for normal cell division
MDIMENEKRKSYAIKLEDVAGDFLQYISDEFSDCSSYFGEKIEEKVIKLLDFEKPKVMVYGIYNSGKSTLINALCREEVAEMADRPMTDQISQYDRGDYLLIDSPGVDAPIEHELVTEEFIDKCHIILFVISTKGVFEDRDNYKRLANLIVRNIPFIIVLNERGVGIKPEWTDEQKKRAKFDHNQELKIIQYKVIQNLVNESNDKHIADKYEVVVLNAKKALTGISRNKPQLYDMSGVGFLEKRITQLLQSNDSIKSLFNVPISNLKECMNEVEKIITENMSGNKSEDLKQRIHILDGKRDNIMQELRILIKQAVYSRLEELTNSYVNEDFDIFETVANTIFGDVDERYSAKINELLVYVDRNFKLFNLSVDRFSNLLFSFEGIQRSVKILGNVGREENDSQFVQEAVAPEVKGFFDFLKSRKKREKEKMERLQMEADIKNSQSQYKVQEQIRRKQEARQLASSDLDELLRVLTDIVIKGMNEKYEDLFLQIQQIDCLNKQIIEDGKRQMKVLNELRNRMMSIENSL